MPAPFIVLEGPDGSGTTLHSTLLFERLQNEGKAVLRTQEPTNTPLGVHIRELLHAQELPPASAIQLLFCADRAAHVEQIILPAMRGDTIVVSDRYALSTIVYGSCLGLSEEWLANVNAPFPSPTLTLLALPPYEVCKERMHRREKLDKFEEDSFQRSVYDRYASVTGEGIVHIDTSGEKQDVAERIYAEVLKVL